VSDFGAALHAFAQSTGIKCDKVVRKVAIDMDRDLVMLTPVDTGLARSNWFFGNTRETSVDKTASKNGDPSIHRGLEFASTLRAGGIFYITNNVPYIMRLEYGSSTQAPAGMARITVARWQQTVDAAVRSL
jgi:hypothetical protein